MTGANLDITSIALQVIQSMRNGNARRERLPIMVEDRYRFILGIDSSFAIELPNQFSFFVSILNTGLPATS